MGIEVRGLKFSYGGHEVLRGVNFDAGEGQLIALLGSNGAGKSTMMRCMLGFLTGYRGSILIDENDVKKMTRAQLARKIAYIPQSSPITFNYRVLDMVLMGATANLGLLSSPGAGHERRAWEILENLGIGRLANRGYEEISGGERQLVLLARALIQDAKILIMDEPTANLDYGNQNRVMAEVSALAERGYTILFSTHDPNQALLYATRALILHDGKILADGAPDIALTEKTLATIYGINVQLCTFDSADGSTKTICAPGKPGKRTR